MAASAKLATHGDRFASEPFRFLRLMLNNGRACQTMQDVGKIPVSVGKVLSPQLKGLVRHRFGLTILQLPVKCELQRAQRFNYLRNLTVVPFLKIANAWRA